jgi:hypothetical protein
VTVRIQAGPGKNQAGGWSQEGKGKTPPNRSSFVDLALSNVISAPRLLGPVLAIEGKGMSNRSGSRRGARVFRLGLLLLVPAGTTVHGLAGTGMTTGSTYS